MKYILIMNIIFWLPQLIVCDGAVSLDKVSWVANISAFNHNLSTCCIVPC